MMGIARSLDHQFFDIFKSRMILHFSIVNLFYDKIEFFVGLIILLLFHDPFPFCFLVMCFMIGFCLEVVFFSVKLVFFPKTFVGTFIITILPLVLASYTVLRFSFLYCVIIDIVFTLSTTHEFMYALFLFILEVALCLQ